MYFTVYRVTNNINGKSYVGVHKTRNLSDGYLGSGKLLLEAFRKYGRQAFTKEILFVYDNSIDMYAREREIVNEDFISRRDTYNLRLGGDGGFQYTNESGLNINQTTFRRGNPAFSGRAWMTNGAETISVKLEDIDKWIDLGYRRGRTLRKLTRC